MFDFFLRKIHVLIIIQSYVLTENYLSTRNNYELMIRINSKKKKLTLSINSEVIEKAKKLGLNLSEITEKALKISSLSDDQIVTPDKLREVYIDILKIILKILKKWDLRQLKIGGFYEEDGLIYYWYQLAPDRVNLWSDIPAGSGEPEEPVKTWHLEDENLPISNFDDPEKIITSLIDKLYDKANKNKEILNKLQILKNILELSGLSK